MAEEQGPAYWFVGAARGGTDDKTDELVAGGIWRFWPDPEKPEEYRDKILEMRPGDRIAIKAAYTRKYGLPFNAQGHRVSTMSIKAIGEITENPGDGSTVKVNWYQRFDPPREWYFYTNRHSVWKLDMSSWYSQALVAFAFDGEEQDIELFRNEPYWRERFGDADQTDSRFSWTVFYEAFATKLLEYENRREELVAGLRELVEGQQVPNIGYIFEKDEEGNKTFLEDICPFTIMGAFNRGGTDENRLTVAAALARLIGLHRSVPESFEGIPVLNNLKSRFFWDKWERDPEDIDRLWSVFRAALEYADAEGEESALRQGLAERYDEVVAQKGAGWNLSIGLYWIRPWEFLPLDQHTRNYVRGNYAVQLPEDYHKLAGEQYLELLDRLQERMDEEEASEINSFPAISLAAWSRIDSTRSTVPGEESEALSPVEPSPAPPQRYTLDHVVEEGAFLPRSELETMLHRFQHKRNIILQGPPGTGKTWLSKKLAYALMGFQDEANLIPLQFHPTLSYEDFVRGWRPSASGTLDLVDGPFMQAINRALENPESRCVVVIEEINRGNPAQIFGEMLTLMEGDKRSREHGMRLSHMREGEGHVYVPRNLYVIGTMNIADRSLALVDLALRRRFAFFDLEPQLNEAWVTWMVWNTSFGEDQVRDIQARIHHLNEVITSDEALGPQFRIGHSYVMPRVGAEIPSDARQWFGDVVATEIRPLLEEYWFDRPDQAREQADRLVADW